MGDTLVQLGKSRDAGELATKQVVILMVGEQLWRGRMWTHSLGILDAQGSFNTLVAYTRPRYMNAYSN